MNKRTIIAVLAIIAVAVAAFIWTSARNSDGGPYAYDNPQYGYSLQVPAGMMHREISPENAVVGRIMNESIEVIAVAQIVTVGGNAGQTLAGAAAEALQTLCASESPTTAVSCTGIERTEAFATGSGILGSVIYLSGESLDLQTGEKDVIVKGPYVILPLQTSATMTRVLVIQPPMGVNAPESDETAILAIAGSVKAEKAVERSMGIEDYVRLYISDISPVKEQLGGKFYVTEIGAEGGSGTVSYEDGHSAYTADFRYSTDDRGAIMIDSFEVRD